MAFAGNVCEQVGDIAKGWLFGTNAAQKRYVGRHDKWQRSSGSSPEALSDELVRSVSGAGEFNSKGQCLQRNGVQTNDTKGAC